MSSEGNSEQARHDDNSPQTDPSSDPAVLQRRRDAEEKLDEFHEQARNKAEKENGDD